MNKSEYFFNSLINGDSKGIFLLYKSVFPKVLSFVSKNNGYKADAEDVFQKTLLQMAIRFKGENKPFISSFEAYLFSACKNQWRRELNNKKLVVTNLVKDEQVNEIEEMVVSIAQEEKWNLYQEKFQLLSDKCIEILRLFFREKSHKDIASILSYASPAVARQKVFKCRNRLSALIKKDLRYKIIINTND